MTKLMFVILATLFGAILGGLRIWQAEQEGFFENNTKKKRAYYILGISFIATLAAISAIISIKFNVGSVQFLT